eukprot:763180-Hanusia_phi.AAC.1
MSDPVFPPPSPRFCLFSPLPLPSSPHVISATRQAQILLKLIQLFDCHKSGPGRMIMSTPVPRSPGRRGPTSPITVAAGRPGLGRVLR